MAKLSAEDSGYLMRLDPLKLIQFIVCQATEYGEQIVATLSRQLGWYHSVAIIPFDDDLKRDFYAEMCRIESWSTCTLEKKILKVAAA